MIKKNEIDLALIEKIFNELYKNLEKCPEFDDETTQKLKDLAYNNELSNFEKVISIIKYKGG